MPPTLEEQALRQAALALRVAESDSSSVRPLADLARHPLMDAWARQAQLDVPVTGSGAAAPAAGVAASTRSHAR